MLTAFIRAFKTPDLRKKLLFTLFIILIFRLGAQLPTPGVSVKAIKACTDIANNGSQATLTLELSVFVAGGPASAEAATASTSKPAA